MASSPPRLPRKRFHRQRAHANVFSDHRLDYPPHPALADWHALYPRLVAPSPAAAAATSFIDRLNAPPPPPDAPVVRVLDVGCGYGGLLVALAPLFPAPSLLLGLEIRPKVCAYVDQRIRALRAAHSSSSSPPLLYENIAVIRANAQKFLPHFIRPAQLHKIFFLFPDPHFKKRKHKARIITPTLLGDYAYLLAPQARLYIATDVHDLFLDMSAHLNASPLFDPLPQDLVDADPAVQHVRCSTEEGKKVARNHGSVYLAVYVRRPTHRDASP